MADDGSGFLVRFTLRRKRAQTIFRIHGFACSPFPGQLSYDESQYQILRIKTEKKETDHSISLSGDHKQGLELAAFDDR